MKWIKAENMPRYLTNAKGNSMHKLSTRIKESKDTNGNYLFWKKQRQSGLNRVYIWQTKINQRATYMGETEWAHAKVLFSTGCSAKPKKKFQILFCQCLICSKVNLTSYFAKTLYLAVNQNSKRKEKTLHFQTKTVYPRATNTHKRNVLFPNPMQTKETTGKTLCPRKYISVWGERQWRLPSLLGQGFQDQLLPK